jgi:hypothetical protein
MWLTEASSTIVARVAGDIFALELAFEVIRPQLLEPLGRKNFMLNHLALLSNKSHRLLSSIPAEGAK